MSDGPTIERFKEGVKELLRGKPYAEHIYYHIFDVSNSERDTEDINALRDVLCTLTMDEEYKVPLKWYKLKEHIQDKAKETLTWEEVYEMAKSVDIHEEDNVKAALSFFHEVGDLVYFNDPELSGIIITSPQWLMDQLKQIITIRKSEDQTNSKEVMESERHAIPRDSLPQKPTDSHWKDLEVNGILRESLTQELWHTENIRKVIINILLKFGFILPRNKCKYQFTQDTENNDYMVPWMMPRVGTSCPSIGSGEHYKVTPSQGFSPIGMTSRLIAKLTNKHGWEIPDPFDATRALLRVSGECTIHIGKLPGYAIGLFINRTQEFTQKYQDLILDTLESLQKHSESNFGIKMCDKWSVFEQQSRFTTRTNVNPATSMGDYGKAKISDLQVRNKVKLTVFLMFKVLNYTHCFFSFTNTQY